MNRSRHSKPLPALALLLALSLGANVWQLCDRRAARQVETAAVQDVQNALAKVSQDAAFLAQQMEHRAAGSDPGGLSDRLYRVELLREDFSAVAFNYLLYALGDWPWGSNDSVRMDVLLLLSDLREGYYTDEPQAVQAAAQTYLPAVQAIVDAFALSGRYVRTPQALYALADGIFARLDAALREIGLPD